MPLISKEKTSGILINELLTHPRIIPNGLLIISTQTFIYSEHKSTQVLTFSLILRNLGFILHNSLGQN